ncbi:bestrophin family protein [Runella sp.]|uniref:bestrophin family protein n=1 Tax=Runella sp. TaxID=1960881 RepID=UPI003D09C804
MHAGSHYTIKEFLLWTRREIYILLVLAIVPTVLYHYLGWHWLAVPWVPITLVGTAAAFIVGFKNTQTYNRLWEARQIWGAIVNGSRAWGIMVKDGVIAPDAAADAKVIHRQLIYRHIAWLTALRFQLRESRAWENMNKSYNKEYSQFFTVAEKVQKLDEELKKFLSADELAYVLSKKNRATHIISLQSKHLRELKQQQYIESLSYIELENLLVNFYEQQGKCERIKNFPYPRQFASINLFFVRLFVFMVPFGMLKEFEKLGEHMVWLTIPFSVLVSWVFSSMEKVGESTENPFEGGANDVPITSMSRTIEIDLREMLDETDLPPAIQAVNNILM